MASTSSPYGLIPISDMTGTPRVMRIPNGIASGLASNIFTNQPVKMATSGTITPITATSDQIYGVFMGVYYTPTGGRPTESPMWPASATYDTTNDMFAYVSIGWGTNSRFQIQADGSVPQISLGQQFNLSNFGNGQTAASGPGLSQCTANATAVTIGVQGQLVLLEFFPGVNSAIGDAYTDLIVGIAYPQVVSGYQTSIG